LCAPSELHVSLTFVVAKCFCLCFAHLNDVTSDYIRIPSYLYRFIATRSSHHVHTNETQIQMSYPAENDKCKDITAYTQCRYRYLNNTEGHLCRFSQHLLFRKPLCPFPFSQQIIHTRRSSTVYTSACGCLINTRSEVNMSVMNMGTMSYV